jgi:uncharacterized NAD(P)/FAD-binding protein YdhS
MASDFDDIVCACGHAVHDKQSEKSLQIKPVDSKYPPELVTLALHEVQAWAALLHVMP